MNSEKQYIDLFKAQRNVICGNSCDAMNAVLEQMDADDFNTIMNYAIAIQPEI